MKHRFIPALICTFMLFALCPSPEAYRWVDENGVYHISNKPSPDRSVLTHPEIKKVPDPPSYQVPPVGTEKPNAAASNTTALLALAALVLIVIVFVVTLRLFYQRKSRNQKPQIDYGQFSPVKMEPPTTQFQHLAEEFYEREGLDASEVDQIQIWETKPKGLPHKLVEYTPIAGVSMPERREIVYRFAFAEYHKLELEREPENPYDSNAIKVIGHWHNENEEKQSGLLGYLPRDRAMGLALEYPEGPLAATLKMIFLPQGDKGPGFRIDVWGKRRKKAAKSSEKPPGGDETNFYV